jgi:hypothetical protein
VPLEALIPVAAKDEKANSVPSLPSPSLPSLSVAERDELAHMQGPGAPAVLDAARYERLLPFAVALEVEGAWTAKFTAAAGAAGIGWYRGGPISNLGELSHAVGSSLNSSIASAATPPGSSSGGGGGGSSGGGGGGGGGGGR